MGSIVGVGALFIGGVVLVARFCIDVAAVLVGLAIWDRWLKRK